jgi:hypothetical protein
MNTCVPARRKPEETGQLGEAMRKLINARSRALVEFYLLESQDAARKPRRPRRAGAPEGNGLDRLPGPPSPSSQR